MRPVTVRQMVRDQQRHHQHDDEQQHRRGEQMRERIGADHADESADDPRDDTPVTHPRVRLHDNQHGGRDPGRAFRIERDADPQPDRRRRRIGEREAQPERRVRRVGARRLAQLRQMAEQQMVERTRNDDQHQRAGAEHQFHRLDHRNAECHRQRHAGMPRRHRRDAAVAVRQSRGERAGDEHDPECHPIVAQQIAGDRTGDQPRRRKEQDAIAAGQRSVLIGERQQQAEHRRHHRRGAVVQDHARERRSGDADQEQGAAPQRRFIDADGLHRASLYIRARHIYLRLSRAGQRPGDSER